MSDEPTEPERHYGTDSTDEGEAIAEATVQEDGTVHLTAVVLERADAIVSDLAERGAPLSDDEETCWFCESVAAAPVDRHAEDCAWRRASTQEDQ